MDPARLLEGLSAESPRVRDLAAAELGDLLRSGSLDATAVGRIAARLVELAAVEPDPVVLEQVLNSIADAFDHHELPLALVAPITGRMPTMNAALLEHALYILAGTHDRAALPAIDEYAAHPDPRVRDHAAEARQELSREA